MSDHTQKLAALVGSRICHDLISPVGAIQNGVELLAMEGRASPELSLIEESVKNASARIRFMRIAFGSTTQDQPVSRHEIEQTLENMGHAGRVRYAWAVNDACTRGEAQQIFLAILCLESAMPRGGTIVVNHDATGWAVTGPAELDRIDPDLWESLRGQDAKQAQPAHVQFPLLASILAAQNAVAQVINSQNGITICTNR